MIRLKKLLVILRKQELLLALIVNKVFAGVEHRSALSRPIATVIDIGANRGQFALAARFFTKAKIVSFEPLLSASIVFRKLFVKSSDVLLHQVAISDQYGAIDLHISASDDSSSLLKIGSSQDRYFPGTYEVGVLKVLAGPLDRFISAKDIIRPSMLKLDVQGFEMNALLGCKSLFDYFDYIYCECSFIELYEKQKLASEIINFLSDFQFNLIGIYNPSYGSNGDPIQADFLFSKSGV